MTLRRVAPALGPWVFVCLIAAMLAVTVAGAMQYRNEWTFGVAYLTHRNGAVVYLDVDASKGHRDEVVDVAAGDTLPLFDARDSIKLTNGEFVIECRLYCADRRLRIKRGLAIVVRGHSTFRYGAGSTIPAPRKSTRPVR